MNNKNLKKFLKECFDKSSGNKLSIGCEEREQIWLANYNRLSKKFPLTSKKIGSAFLGNLPVLIPTCRDADGFQLSFLDEKGHPSLSIVFSESDLGKLLCTFASLEAQILRGAVKNEDRGLLLEVFQ